MQQRSVNNHFVIVALDKDTITGMIEVRNYNHISLLYVKKEYLKRGIAKKLLETAIDKSLKHNTNISLIEVNSSPFAIQIYEKTGICENRHRTGQKRYQVYTHDKKVELKKSF